MKKIVLLSAIALFTSFCVQTTTIPSQNSTSVQENNIRSAPITTMEAQELKTLIEQTDSYNNPDECPFVVVNVLGKKLFGDCRIAGSINAPLDELYLIGQEWEQKNWHTNKTVIIYCALDECDASEKAYYLLSGMGFQHLIAYEGGILEWFKLGYPTDGPCAFDYLKTHALLSCDSCPCLGLCSKSLDELQPSE